MNNILMVFAYIKIFLKTGILLRPHCITFNQQSLKFSFDFLKLIKTLYEYSYKQSISDSTFFITIYYNCLKQRWNQWRFYIFISEKNSAWQWIN